MRKIITLLLCFISLSTFAQTYQQVGNTLQRANLGSHYNYRFALGSPGFFNVLDKFTTDSIYLNKVTGGVVTGPVTATVFKSDRFSSSIDNSQVVYGSGLNFMKSGYLVVNGNTSGFRPNSMAVILGRRDSIVANQDPYFDINIQASDSGLPGFSYRLAHFAKDSINLYIKTSFLNGVRLTPTSTLNYVWTATDALGNGSWQPTATPATNFITSNTNQTGLTGNKSSNGAWTFGTVTSPITTTPKLFAGSANLSGISLAGFYNSSVNGNLLVGSNRGGSEGETDFISAVGTASSAIGGFHFSDVDLSGVEHNLFDLNGSTQDATLYGRLVVNNIPTSSSVATKFITTDPATGFFVSRTATQTLSDLTAGKVLAVPLVSGTVTVTITGISSSNHAFVQMLTPSGTSATHNYTAVCTTNTLTITAIESDDTTVNTADGSTLNYVVL